MPPSEESTKSEDKVASSSLQAEGNSFGADQSPKKSQKTLLYSILIILLLALAGMALYFALRDDSKESATTTQQTVKIGVLLPYSGPAAAGGLGVLKGVQLAKKQLNASNIELVQIDSKCDGEAAKKALQEAVSKGVSGIIGEGCSGASLAMVPLANTNKIPMVSPLSSNPGLSIKDDYFFRVVPSDEYQGAFVASLFKEKGLKNVSVLTDEAAGRGLATVFKEEFGKLGGKVVSEGSIERDSTKVDVQISALKAAKPEAVYIVSNSVPTSVAILKSLQASGLKVPLYGSDTMNVNAILTEAGEAAEGLTVATFSSGTKTFKQALANEYPSEEFLFGAAEGYDAFTAFYNAVNKGAVTGEQLKRELSRVDFEGVAGKIKFNENGEVTDKEHKYDLLIAKEGAFVTAE